MSLCLRDPNLLDTALAAWNLIAEDREQWAEFTGRPYSPDEAALECWGYAGPKWAICDETGMALAVAGCQRLRPHVYRSWFLSGEQLWAHGRAVTEITRKVVLEMLADDAHRIETLCLASRTKTRGWYTALGLHFEAEFPNYGASGAPAAQYAICRPPETQ